MTEPEKFIAGLLVGVIVGALVVGLIVRFCADSQWRTDAIRNNAAEWRTDKESGDAVFTWLTKPDAEDVK